MASTTGRLTASMSATELGSDSFSSGPRWSGSMNYIQEIADGVAADQADISYMQERAVASGANDDVDLAGVLADIMGVTIAAAELVAIMVINAPKDPDDTVNTTTLTIGGATAFAPGFENALSALPVGGCFFMASAALAGISAITATSADLIRITNSAGATNNYQLGLLMRTA